MNVYCSAHQDLLHVCLICLTDSSMTECGRILYRIIEGDSDKDFSEQESEERIAEAGEDDADEEQDDFEQDAEPEEVDQDVGPEEVRRRPLWVKTSMKAFKSKLSLT